MQIQLTEEAREQLLKDFETHWKAIPYKGATKEAFFHDWLYERLIELYAERRLRSVGTQEPRCPKCGSGEKLTFASRHIFDVICWICKYGFIIEEVADFAQFFQAAAIPTVPQNDSEDHVAWLRYVNAGENTHISVCDSNDPKAFKVYRHRKAIPPEPSPGAGEWAGWARVADNPAPKAGTEFLAWDENQRWKAVAWWDQVHHCFVYTGGTPLFHFTHWQPLPAPPRQDGGSK